MAWDPSRTEFDEYRVVRRLGRGGMGQVFLAQDTLLDRLVAVKFIGVNLVREAWARERFFIEARAAARLQHPNVVSVYRVGVVEDMPYLVSEFIRGKSLDQLKRPMPWTDVRDLALGLTRGLAAAHRHGILHRDIKPHNAILTDGGDVKLLDFGLAKFLDDGAADPQPPPQPEPPPPPPPAPQPDTSGDDNTMPAPRPSADVVASPVDGAGGHGMTNPTGQPRTPVNGARTPPPRGSTPLTQVGAVLGTPYYIAPEIWNGEPATRQSDVYSLGAVLFELATGRPPHGDVNRMELVLTAVEKDAPPVGSLATIDPELAAIIDRCLRRVPSERYNSGEEMYDAVERLRASATAALPEGNPYRGLATFEAEQRALFFGRDRAVRSVVERLRVDPFVLIAGDSGVGKSSLCRAGVLPEVVEHGVGDLRRWRSITVVPGRQPAAALAAALAPIFGEPESAIVSGLDDPAELARRLRASQGTTSGLLLFVDQLEELVTVAERGVERVPEFLAELAVMSPSIRVLATVRGDFLTRVVALPRLGEEVAKALYLLAPLTGDGLREAIVGPARAKGVEFESPELVAGLVAETAGAEGGLPLLQFALAEMWEARDASRSVLTREDIDKLGGVTGALARHADGVLERMRPDERAAAAVLLKRMVTAENTRVRRTRDELVVTATDQSALDTLVSGRLVVAAETETGATYELAHDALIAGWRTLQSWLRQDESRRLLRERVVQATAEWERHDRVPALLWRGPQLVGAELVDDSELLDNARSFIARSRAAQRRRRLVQWAIAFAVLAAVIAVYVGLRIKQRHDLDRRVNALVADAHAVLDPTRQHANELAKLRSSAFDAFDHGDRAAGEERWQRALALEHDVEAGYGHASQVLESAIAVDPDAVVVRDLLADVLEARALLAEQRGADPAELLARMALYDDGARRARWSAPASLAAQTDPSNARIAVERFVESEGQPGRWQPVAVSLPAEVPPGSYRLIATADGRATVRYPILLRRGAHESVRLQLPAVNEVPPGFVVVPPGRFLIGSLDEALRAQYLDAPPLHEVQSDGYLIAQRETTFRDWIAYLDAIDPAERAAHTPRSASVGQQGSLELRKLNDGRWQLTLQPGAKAYVAAEGEPIHFPNRKRRADQDWREFPVAGISHDDAVAYVSWLARTKRVPSARLCTEAEWERAARGADGRRFPHGDVLRADDANFEKTYDHDGLAIGPDQTGSHPASNSPFEVMDLAGNVWELTGPTATARGGAYPFDENGSRADKHESVETTLRDPTLGLRVCATPSNLRAPQ